MLQRKTAEGLKATTLVGQLSAGRRLGENRMKNHRRFTQMRPFLGGRASSDMRSSLLLLVGVTLPEYSRAGRVCSGWCTKWTCPDKGVRA